MRRIFFPLFLLLLSLDKSLSKNVLPIIFQFIYDNEKICNDPFSDPQWLPALEDCQLDCDITSQICQENVMKVFPGQRCVNLPANCAMALKSLLNVDPETPAIQVPLAPLTIPPLSNQAFQHLATPETPQFQHFSSRRVSETFLTGKVFKDSIDSRPPAIAPSPPAYNPADQVERNSVTTMPPEYEDERNVENSEFVQSQTTSGGGYYSFTPQPISKQPGYREKNLKKHRNPISWNLAQKKLRKRPFYSIEEGKTVVDRSAKCCQWALDGLCDRNWQKIRTLCPKSCGTIVCTAIDGALSCNRAIDVDVLDCFQRKHLTLALGSPTVRNQNPPTKTYKKKLKPDYETDVQNRNSFAVANAFTIENEIRSFLSLG